jgi:nucleotide-binding universal stress UspA family protein
LRVFRRIRHPSDFSPASAPAFAVAVKIAKVHRARLLIAHVLRAVPVVPDVYLATRLHESLARGRHAQGQRQLTLLVARARRAGVRAVGLLLDFGAVHERIVRVADSRRVQLIVIDTHGRTGFSKATLGSVAERVVSSARCPVLTVRARP